MQLNISPDTIRPDQRANFVIGDATVVPSDATTWLQLAISSPSGAAGVGIAIRDTKSLHVRMDPTTGADETVERGAWTARVYNLIECFNAIRTGNMPTPLAEATFTVTD